LYTVRGARHYLTFTHLLTRLRQAFHNLERGALQMKPIEIVHSNCVGCRLCEMVCSLVHEGECSTAMSRIRIYRDEEFGNNLVSLCLQCDDAYCIDSCAYGALNRDEKTGVVAVDDKSCTACEACVAACPIGAIYLNKEKDTVFKCDLCGGDPECVKFCSRGALILKEADISTPARKSFRAETSKLLSQLKT
ncbi:4Fe-4S dicluster domain-containing protein, partial [Chloroflexota bacterium]